MFHPGPSSTASGSSRALQAFSAHKLKRDFGPGRQDVRGEFMPHSPYFWLVKGDSIILYSQETACVLSSRSFGNNPKNEWEITFVQELHKNEETTNMLLVGCSCKTYGLLFVCQLPTLTTIRCIHTLNPIHFISIINNELIAKDELSAEFKVMSTVLIVGMATGKVYAVDLKQFDIKNKRNESRPSQLYILRKTQDSQDSNQISVDSDLHLTMFINENFYDNHKNQCSGKLKLNISSLLYIKEINAIAIGYTTGHVQLYDCYVMETLFVLKKPECDMPVTHITFLEPSNDPKNQCYLWVIRSDNSRLPNATMIALTYEQRTMLSNGCLSYKGYKENMIKLDMSLRRETGIGRCLSTLALSNDTLVRDTTGIFKDCPITLFAMLMEIRQNVDANPESYIFLFDINQWYKAQMPSSINHLEVSNSYANFVKLPDYASYLDFNISDKTLRPFGFNFRNDVEEFYYPTSIYFEFDCLLDTQIIRFKHAGVQQQILDQLLLENSSLFINPSLIFSQCLQTNLRPFFWDKSDDYVNYSSFDKLHFVLSIIVENNIMSVFDECAEKWKNGTYSEVIILHLVRCLWNHAMLVKQYADQLCIPLFDCSGMPVGKKYERMLSDCLLQMIHVENVFKGLQFVDDIQINNGKFDLVNRVKLINLVIQYLNSMIHFLNFKLLPNRIEEDRNRPIIQCDFNSLIQYARKRRMVFGDLPLYLIDAIITNEPKANKLIEQWKDECVEETKGLYPPSNVQSLLRIYLNAEISNRVQNFIIIYFLIDVCSTQEMDELNANIFNDTIVKNEELYKLCCASWLLDHDMFEDAMLIYASNNEWMINDKSWNWYHWTVLKLFVFKKQYYWAQVYFDLFDIKLVNLHDHKFYLNLQIMNNQCFDALCHLRTISRKIEEKNILFEYVVDRCRHTNQLKAFLYYSLDLEEKKLFFSCLKKFEDTKSIQFKFLVQEKRYLEAFKLCKSLKDNTNSKYDSIVSIVSSLVGKVKNNIHPNNISDLEKKVFSNEEIKMTFMNCFMDNHTNMKKSNSFRSDDKSCQINLIVPNDDKVNNIQGHIEKVSSVNGVLCPSKIETVKQIEKTLLKLLDTPFIRNISNLPSVTNHLSVPKTKSTTFNKQLSRIKLDETPQTLTYGLPYNDDTKVEKFSHKESISEEHSENENIGNSDTKKSLNNTITKLTPNTFLEALKDNSKIELLESVPLTKSVDTYEYEKMDTSDNYQLELCDIHINELNIENMRLGEEQIPVSDSLLMNTSSSTLKVDNKLLASVPVDMEKTFNQHFKSLNSLVINNCSPIPDIKDNLKSNELQFNYGNTDCSILDTNSSVHNQVKILNYNDNNLILLDSDKNKSDGDLENSIYCKLKSLKGLDGEACRNEDIGSDNTKMKYVVDVYDDNYLEPDVILEGKNYENLEKPHDLLNNLEDTDVILFDDVINIENSDQLSVVSDSENLEEPNVIIESKNYGNLIDSRGLFINDNYKNLDDTDVILDVDTNVKNNSDQLSVLPDGENDDTEPNVIFESEYYKNLEDSDVILDDDKSVSNNSDKPNVSPDGENYDNLKEPDVILFDDVINIENSDQLSVVSDSENLEEPNVIIESDNHENLIDSHGLLPINDNYNNLDDTDVILNVDANVQNNSDQSSVLPDKENDDKESCVLLKNVEDTDVILDDKNVSNNSDQPSVSPDCENYENLKEPDVIIFDDVINIDNSDQLSVIPDGENIDNFEELNVILEGENDEDTSVLKSSDQPSVLPVDEIKKNVKDTDIMFEGKNKEKPNASVQNIKNEDMVDCDNVILYPTDSQSCASSNLIPYNNDITEKNRSNYDYQICDEENTVSDNKSSAPINFQDIESHKDDFSNDQSKDYPYDEYQFSNNDIFSEYSSIAFNPIPEYGFNHLTMSGNELNQLDVYETLNQPTSVLLNESFLNNISFSATTNVIETQDSVVGYHVEKVTDTISEENELSSSNTNIIEFDKNNDNIDTFLYNQEIKSCQQVESEDVLPQQIDTDILNSTKKEYAVVGQKRYFSASLEPSKPLIIEEFPPNNMISKDVQEKTTKLVDFVKSNSNTENCIKMADNLHNSITNDTNEHPFIELIDKNIPNLPKRSTRTKSISPSDQKLTTGSKSESIIKQVKLKIISSTYENVEDCLSMSKKRTKCQKKTDLVKRSKVCMKYVTSIDEASKKKTDLKEISEESTTNKDKTVKEIEELLPNNLSDKDTSFQEELTKLPMPVMNKQDSVNNDRALNQNVDFFHRKNIKKMLYLEPKIILTRIDDGILLKNGFKQHAMAREVPLSIKKTKSQKPVALKKRIRSGYLKSMKEPTATNTIIDVKEDSINNDKIKAVTKKSKLNSSYKYKKIKLDKNLKSSSDQHVLTVSKSEPIKRVNKIHNSLIEETMNFISNDGSVANEKLDWKIISQAKTNTDTIPKIRIGRNKNELNTISDGSQLDFEANKQGTDIVGEQELCLMKKSNESKVMKFNQHEHVRRRSSRKISKRPKCSCCANKLVDVVHSSNI